MRIVTLNPNEPRQDRMDAILEVLDSGGLVALPTETFYGLAVDCMNPGALARVNRAKGKAPDDPVLLLVDEARQVAAIAEELPPIFDTLVERFWPGPLTLVVRASSRLPGEIFGGRGTVAVRAPGLALPRRLAAALGRPISGVSANRHGEPPCRSAVEVAQALPGELDMIADGGETAGGAPSTILDLTTPEPRVLREGLLPRASLEPTLTGTARGPV